MATDDPLKTQLERFGIGDWSDKGVIQPMPDGYWTPWHIAEARLAAIEAENVALREELRARGNGVLVPGPALTAMQDELVALRASLKITEELSEKRALRGS